MAVLVGLQGGMGVRVTNVKGKRVTWPSNSACAGCLQRIVVANLEVATGPVGMVRKNGLDRLRQSLHFEGVL